MSFEQKLSPDRGNLTLLMLIIAYEEGVLQLVHLNTNLTSLSFYRFLTILDIVD